MQKIKCPVCKQQGVLQWKETVTKIKGKEYHYKKLYVYHQHPKEHPEKPKWCYLNRDHLKALGITQKLTQNKRKSKNLNLRLVNEDKQGNRRAGSSVWYERRLRKAEVAGSNPARSTFKHVRAEI